MSETRNQPPTVCARARRLLELQVDHRLSLSGRAELARHVAGCAPCRQTQAELEALNRLLGALPGYCAPQTFVRAVSDRVRRTPVAWRPRHSRLGPLPWRALVWETLAAVLMVSVGAAWITRGAGWTHLDRTARLAAREVTVLTQQGRRAWTPRPIPLAEVKTALVDNVRTWRATTAAVIRPVLDLPFGPGRWFSRSSVLLWWIVVVVLLINVFLELTPFPSPANSDRPRRFST